MALAAALSAVPPGIVPVAGPGPCEEGVPGLSPATGGLAVDAAPGAEELAVGRGGEPPPLPSAPPVVVSPETPPVTELVTP